MTDQTERLKKAAAKYRRAKERAAEIERQASTELATEIRGAYADGKGMRKSEILRATDHVWSRTWLDQTLKTNEEGDNPSSTA
jgi:hypothetical protein